jgi:hypothetical protein
MEDKDSPGGNNTKPRTRNSFASSTSGNRLRLMNVTTATLTCRGFGLALVLAGTILVSAHKGKCLGLGLASVGFIVVGASFALSNELDQNTARRHSNVGQVLLWIFAVFFSSMMSVGALSGVLSLSDSPGSVKVATLSVLKRIDSWLIARSPIPPNATAPSVAPGRYCVGLLELNIAAGSGFFLVSIVKELKKKVQR